MFLFLTHGLELVQQVISAPPHAVVAVCHCTQKRTAFPRILQGRHVQVVDQHDVGVLSHTHTDIYDWLIPTLIHFYSCVNMLLCVCVCVCFCVCVCVCEWPAAASSIVCGMSAQWRNGRSNHTGTETTDNKHHSTIMTTVRGCSFPHLFLTKEERLLWQEKTVRGRRRRRRRRRRNR